MQENRNNEDNNNQNKSPFNMGSNRFALILLFAFLGLVIMLFLFNDMSSTQEISYSLFLQKVREGKVPRVDIIDNYEIQGEYRNQENNSVIQFKTYIPYIDDGLIDFLEEQNVEVNGKQRGLSPLRIFFEILPWIIGFAIIWFMFRQMQGGGGKAFSFGKSKAKKYQENESKITFADVAGQKEAKSELVEVVEFLKTPTRFTQIGARIPKGVLLVGMPGTGKTLLAKAIAGEAGVNFFHMSGSDFVEMFVGVGASRVRDLFEQGRKNAPCIIFIDELDAVGRTRGAGYGGGHDEREQTLNQMLVEMDGFDTKDGVIMIAATNRPDVLDPALLRPGRFDRQVVVDMPDVQEREEILKIHIDKIKVNKEVDLNRVARATPGTSGADLANLVNEAALLAARQNKAYVEMADFEEARDKTLMGIARHSRVISPEEKLMTAYHEGGHAMMHYYCEYADPLHKVTVIPRGRALGVAISLPTEDKYSRNKGWLLDRIKIAMGGYVAEEIVYNQTSTGTQNDLKQATDIAHKMVCEWGMSKELGPVAYGNEDEPIFIGKEIAQHKEYSENTAQKIDQEVRLILSDCFEQTRKILRDNKDKLELLATTLVARETLDDIEIRKLLDLPGVEKKET